MNITINVPDNVVENFPFEDGQEHNQTNIEKIIRESLAIRAYIAGRLSLGEVAEIFGKGYIETSEWLHNNGIDPTVRYDAETEMKQDENVKKVLDMLK